MRRLELRPSWWRTRCLSPPARAAAAVERAALHKRPNRAKRKPLLRLRRLQLQQALRAAVRAVSADSEPGTDLRRRATLRMWQ